MSLLEWIQENTDLNSLEELSLASGIDFPSLRKINNGEALPSVLHVNELRRVFPNMPLEVMRNHVIAEPEYITTRRGTLPTGTELHMGTIGDLQVGDYIPYIPSKGSNALGSHWVQVMNLSKQNGLVSWIDYGGQVVPHKSQLSIRFARIAD